MSSVADGNYSQAYINLLSGKPEGYIATLGELLDEAGGSVASVTRAVRRGVLNKICPGKYSLNRSGVRHCIRCGALCPPSHGIGPGCVDVCSSLCTNAYSEERRRGQFIDMAKEWMERNYQRRLVTVGDMANEVDLDGSDDREAFLKYMGTRFADMIGKVRVRHAVEMLRDPWLSGRKVSQLCGFCNEGHYRVIMERELGMSPAAYRLKEYNN